MKYLMVALLALVACSCTQSYVYESQQRAGDKYDVQWITQEESIQTCIIVSSGPVTTSKDGLKTLTHKFVPKLGSLLIYDMSGALIESVPLKDWIYYCNAKGYIKIARTKRISNIMDEDYRVMDYELIDHLKSTKRIP